MASTAAYGGGIIEEMGGLAVYQRMSSVRQGNDRGGRKEVLIQWLIDMGRQQREAEICMSDILL